MSIAPGPSPDDRPFLESLGYRGMAFSLTSSKATGFRVNSQAHTFPLLAISEATARI
jgi:hypothetical protein